MVRRFRANTVYVFLMVVGIVHVNGASATHAQTSEQQEAREILQKVVQFYRSSVGYQGAYLWTYAADLSAQQGEEVASRTSGWTQPPGTPSVGEAYLEAWRLSGDPVCLEAAIECAQALVKTQLRSGGWYAHIDLSEEGRKKYNYRHGGDSDSRHNYTTFDDNKSQSAMTLLMHVDEATGFRNDEIHEAVVYGLASFLKAQYPNGGWPQQYREFPDPDEFPVVKATIPEAWPRTFPGAKYVSFYTLNDGNMSRLVEMFLEAHRIYGDETYLNAALKTGDFFCLAQLPEPQPGWAQQYDSQMHPVWARKFEPPSITGLESQGVMQTLLLLYEVTGNRKYVAPIEPALKYYQRLELPDGQLARFYELHTDKPLYFDRQYQLTYSDSDTPTHYGFKVSNGLKKIAQRYQQLQQQNVPIVRAARHASPVKRTTKVVRQAQDVIRKLDARGAWVESGRMEHSDQPLDVLQMKTLVRNLPAIAALAGAVEQ